MDLILTKFKKSIIALAAIVLLSITGVGIGIYLHAPSHVLAFDINPSIEIHINRLGQVASIDPVNEDGIKIMAGYQLTSKDLEDVIKDIANRLLLNGYLTSDKTNEILLSSDSSNGLINKANTAITNYLSAKKLKVAVMEQTLNNRKEIKVAAHVNHISVGKMALIEKLMETDTNSQYTIKDLSKLSIKQLMGYFKAQNISLEELAKKYAVIVVPQTNLAEPQVIDTATPQTTDTPTPQATDTPAPQATDTPVPQATDTPAPQATDTPALHVTATPASDASQNGVDMTSSATQTVSTNDNSNINKNNQGTNTKKHKKEHKKQHLNKSVGKTEDSKVESDNENDSNKNDIEENDNNQNDEKDHSNVKQKEDQGESDYSDESDNENSNYNDYQYNDSSNYGQNNSYNNNTYEDNHSKGYWGNRSWSGWGHDGEDD